MNVRYVNQENKQEIAYKVIVEKIESGEYPPGMLLVERQLAEQLDMSRTPVRAALQRLASEDELVETVPYLGTAVKAITPQDVDEIYGLRVVVETAALKSFVARADDNAYARLDSFISNMEEAFSQADYGAVRAACQKRPVRQYGQGKYVFS